MNWTSKIVNNFHVESLTRAFYLFNSLRKSSKFEVDKILQESSKAKEEINRLCEKMATYQSKNLELELSLKEAEVTILKMLFVA